MALWPDWLLQTFQNFYTDLITVNNDTIYFVLFSISITELCLVLDIANIRQREVGWRRHYHTADDQNEATVLKGHQISH